MCAICVSRVTAKIYTADIGANWGLIDDAGLSLRTPVHTEIWHKGQQQQQQRTDAACIRTCTQVPLQEILLYRLRICLCLLADPVASLQLAFFISRALHFKILHQTGSGSERININICVVHCQIGSFNCICEVRLCSKVAGDVGGIQIQEVEQLRFVPLADMLCDAIARLNRLGHPATIDTVRAHIADECPTVATPSTEMLHRALQTLLKSGLVYRMREHLFVPIPAAAPYHTSNMPPPPSKCTVECQTGKSIIESPDAIYKQSVTAKQRRGKPLVLSILCTYFQHRFNKV